MSPALNPGDFVLIACWYRKLKVNDIVVFNHNEYGRIIKRVTQINGLGDIQLSGDHASSVSSEAMGWQPISGCLGKVVWTFKPAVS